MPQQQKHRNDPVFFPIMGVLFLLVAVVGFWPSFIVPIGQGKTEFPFALVFHAFVMFCWLGVFITQGVLPGTGKIHLHKRLGYSAVVLFLALWISSITLSIGSFTSTYPPDVRTLINNLFFLQVLAWVISPALFFMAIRARTTATGDHKRYMLLLTFFLIEAAASRIRWLPGMSNDEYWVIVQYLYLDTFLIALAVYDLFSLGRLAHATKVGLVIFAVYQLTVVATWNSHFWLNIADHLLEVFS